ncbi:Tfp pilus assembly protein PilF [Bacillus fengqiuensis]|nr:Tfp pilus assembly protein PilF [Bacillus fengqiuensis]
MSEKVVNYLFYSLIVFILLGVSYAYIQGKKQNEVFKADYQEYQIALKLIDQGGNSQSISILEKQAEKYPDRYNILHKLGLSYAQAGDWGKAVHYYQRAIDQRPFLQMDPVFTMQFAEILFFNNEYVKARAYLEKSKQLPGSERFGPRIEELLTAITKN